MPGNPGVFAGFPADPPRQVAAAMPGGSVGGSSFDAPASAAPTPPQDAAMQGDSGVSAELPQGAAAASTDFPHLRAPPSDPRAVGAFFRDVWQQRFE